MIGRARFREAKHTSRRRPVQFLFAVAVGWLFLVGLLALQFWPKTQMEWLLLVVVGPPVYVFGEAFFGWLFSEAHGNKISSRQFPWLRVALAVVVLLVIFGVPALLSAVRR